jgi:diphthine-ammonia ligase
MCGIVGIFNEKDAFNQIKIALAALHNRGKDKVGIATQDSVQIKDSISEIKDKDNVNPINVLGHTLHSVVSLEPQPLRAKGTLTANCEIYNWQKLAEKYNLTPKNDAGLLLMLLDKFGVNGIKKVLNDLDGVYAFCYWDNNNLILTRDLLGIKPLFYVHNNDQFAFASEKKVLEKLGYIDIVELNPRQTLFYDIKNNKLRIENKDFFSIMPEHKEDKKLIMSNLTKLLDKAINKRIPNKKIGLLFSGGIDSTFIANHLKQKGVDFTCYTAVIESDTVEPEDLIYAKRVAKDLNLNLKIKKIKLDEFSEYLNKVVPLIEDSNVVKVGVALTFYLAAEMAKQDGCKVLFSGLGSEEIFAGYDRHKKSPNINKECLSGLRKIYERDLYRDDVVTMDNCLELRLPFLDVALVDYALKIPTKYKLFEGMGKYILREIALEKGIPQEYALRKKKAAQYGSRIDNAIGRLARREKKNKSAYLKQFYPSHNLKLGILFSSGKDSNYSAYIMKKQNYELACLITLKSKNPYSYMFQSAGVEIVELQAQAMDVPLVTYDTLGEKEKELEDLKDAIKEAKDLYKIDGIVSGAMFSTYQRSRIEKICDELGLKIFSPLWHKGQEQEMHELLRLGFKFIFSSIAADGLDKSWLNKIITLEDVEKLVALRDKIGFNCAGEGGEFESTVIDSPLFEKEISIDEVEVVEESKCSAYLKIKRANLAEKKQN